MEPNDSTASSRIGNPEVVRGIMGIFKTEFAALMDRMEQAISTAQATEPMDLPDASESKTEVKTEVKTEILPRSNTAQHPMTIDLTEESEVKTEFKTEMQPMSNTTQHLVTIDLTEESGSTSGAGNVQSPPLDHPRRPPSPSLFISDDSDSSSLTSLSSVITSFSGRTGGRENTTAKAKAKVKTPAANSQSTVITGI